MTSSYLLARLLHGYPVIVQVKPPLSPGDGLKDLPPAPNWY